MKFQYFSQRVLSDPKIQDFLNIFIRVRKFTSVHQGWPVAPLLLLFHISPRAFAALVATRRVWAFVIAQTRQAYSEAAFVTYVPRPRWWILFTAILTRNQETHNSLYFKLLIKSQFSQLCERCSANSWPIPLFIRSLSVDYTETPCRLLQKKSGFLPGLWIFIFDTLVECA